MCLSIVWPRTHSYFYRMISYDCTLALTQLQMCWAVEDDAFRTFLDGFNETMRRRHTSQRVANIIKWRDIGGRRHFSEDELKWMQMTTTIKVRLRTSNDYNHTLNASYAYVSSISCNYARTGRNMKGQLMLVLFSKRRRTR